MKTKTLKTSKQPFNWYNDITQSCLNYPVHLCKDLNEDSIILDCGCNVGGFVNAYKNKFKNWTCVDASSFNISEFKKNHNLLLNTINLKHAALGATSGEILELKKFTDPDGSDTPSGNFGVIEYVYENGRGWKNNEYEEVESISFEDLLKEYNLDKVDLMKVDIEGSEYEFLYEKDLSNTQYIILELHQFLGTTKIRKLMDWVEQTHVEKYSIGNGINSHYIKLLERK